MGEAKQITLKLVGRVDPTTGSLRIPAAARRLLGAERGDNVNLLFDGRNVLMEPVTRKEK